MKSNSEQAGFSLEVLKFMESLGSKQMQHSSGDIDGSNTCLASRREFRGKAFPSLSSALRGIFALRDILPPHLTSEIY